MNADNPYKSPLHFDTDDIKAARAKLLVSIPAILLLLLASLSILLAAYVGLTIIVDTINILSDKNSISQLPLVIYSNLGFAFVFISYLVIFYGAMQMLKGRRFGVARAAAILAVIPFCSPLFVAGIPLGIWALIVSAKPEVRATFEAGKKSRGIKDAGLPS